MGPNFEWVPGPRGNVEHIARHGVAPHEAEEVFTDPDMVLLDATRLRGERRIMVIGRVSAGDHITVVIAIRRVAIHVVTAYGSSPRQIRRYEQGR
jgi:uncharacterized DUF497 family protein